MRILRMRILAVRYQDIPPNVEGGGVLHRVAAAAGEAGP